MDKRAETLDLYGDTLREECGVFGILGHPEAATLTALGLHALLLLAELGLGSQGHAAHANQLQGKTAGGPAGASRAKLHIR